MKAFEFDGSLIANYAHFSQSFSTLRATDLKSQVGPNRQSRRSSHVADTP